MPGFFFCLSVICLHVYRLLKLYLVLRLGKKRAISVQQAGFGQEAFSLLLALDEH